MRERTLLFTGVFPAGPSCSHRGNSGALTVTPLEGSLKQSTNWSRALWLDDVCMAPSWNSAVSCTRFRTPAAPLGARGACLHSWLQEGGNTVLFPFLAALKEAYAARRVFHRLGLSVFCFLFLFRTAVEGDTCEEILALRAAPPQTVLTASSSQTLQR